MRILKVLLIPAIVLTLSACRSLPFWKCNAAFKAQYGPCACTIHTPWASEKTKVKKILRCLTNEAADKVFEDQKK